MRFDLGLRTFGTASLSLVAALSLAPRALSAAETLSGRRFLRLLTLLAAVLIAPTSSAISMLPNPAVIDLTTIAGQILLTDSTTGLPMGGTVLDGAVGSSDVTLVFQISLTLGGIPDLSVNFNVATPIAPTVTAVGTIAGSGLDIVAGTTAPPGGDGLPGGGFTFDGNLGAGQTSDLLFVSYTSSPVDAIMSFQALGGFVALNQGATIVPEPCTALLVASGLGLLSTLRRRVDTG